MSYEIEFAGSVKEQLKGLPANQRTLVLDSIEQQLTHEPLVETRNHNSLRPNPVAPWELRLGTIRVFCEVAEDDPDTVHILAVGQKHGNILLIGDKEVKLEND